MLPDVGVGRGSGKLAVQMNIRNNELENLNWQTFCFQLNSFPIAFIKMLAIISLIHIAKNPIEDWPYNSGILLKGWVGVESNFNKSANYKVCNSHNTAC